jgi:hypothetical protein
MLDNADEILCDANEGKEMSVFCRNEGKRRGYGLVSDVIQF